MIINSNGANLKETESLIKYVSTELDYKIVLDPSRNYVRDLIDRIVAGYEHQSGKDYTGHLP